MIYSKEELEVIRRITVEQYFQAVHPDMIESKGSGRYNVFWQGEWHTSLSSLPPDEKNPGGRWSFFSQGESGNGALDWLCKMEGLSFIDACQALVGPPKGLDELRSETEEKYGSLEDIKKARAPEPKVFEPPRKTGTYNSVRSYLKDRNVDLSITDFFIREGKLYEDEYRNCVFAGYNQQGMIKYASKRGTGSSYKGEAKGSDKRFGFRHENLIRNSVHFFEGAIDVLSYATYMKQHGLEWRLENLVSLGGIAAGVPEKDAEIQGELPTGIQEFLKNNPGVKTVFLHLDNDLAGRKVTAKVKALLEKEGYKVLDEPSPYGKDWNDYICKDKLKEQEDKEENTGHGERVKFEETDNFDS